MSATYNAAAANEASAYDIFGNPNYPPVYPSMQSPHALDTVGKAADAERARKSLFERIDEIYKDEKKILAARAKAEQRTDPKSPEFKSHFNAEEVLQRWAYFINAKNYSFRDTLMGQFRKWWLARYVDLRDTVQIKKTAFKTAKARNESSPKDQQEVVDANWVFHKQCICWEYLKYWLDDQSASPEKDELRNEDRFRKAEYLEAFPESAFGMVMSVET